MTPIYPDYSCNFIILQYSIYATYMQSKNAFLSKTYKLFGRMIPAAHV